MFLTKPSKSIRCHTRQHSAVAVYILAFGRFWQRSNVYVPLAIFSNEKKSRIGDFSSQRVCSWNNATNDQVIVTIKLYGSLWLLVLDYIQHANLNNGSIVVFNNLAYDFSRNLRLFKRKEKALAFSKQQYVWKNQMNLNTQNTLIP